MTPRRINRNVSEQYFDNEDSSFKVRNDRKGNLFLRIANDEELADMILVKEDKPEFIKFLKSVIKELEKE